LKVLSFATDADPSHYLQQFTASYGLDLQLVGVGTKWTGFSSKVRGFYNHFIVNASEYQDDDIVMILDAYDTIVICDEQHFVDKFNAYEADIVMSTGKECWPDPNLQQFLLNDMDEATKAQHSYFPYFVCINSGAMMGRFPAMLNMVKRVMQLVEEGDGSCSDFQGNKFGNKTQSDQRCYTTYFVEWYNDTTKHAELNIKLDHAHSLFATMGGMMTLNYAVNVNPNDNKNVSVVNTYTGESSCVLHGNGPGVIPWRLFIKQILNNGSISRKEYLDRLSYDFYVSWMDWFTIPYQRVSHYMSIQYGLDMGLHSTNFTEDAPMRFNIVFFTILIVAMSLCCIRSPARK